VAYQPSPIILNQSALELLHAVAIKSTQMQHHVNSPSTKHSLQSIQCKESPTPYQMWVEVMQAYKPRNV
jgi:hypothetical protein